ncbi:MAG: glutamine amidotransferase [Moorea sp. SIO2I5]|nr:glutamine amidotransferase [Moorena sp. SIO2I5]
MTKNAIAITHVCFEDLGSLHQVLEQQGYHVTYIKAASVYLDRIDFLYPDLVIILGGPIGAYDESDYPFLKDELHIIEQRLAANLPTIGICLGAQLMARALGARVYPGGVKEIGWAPIELSYAGQKSPLNYLAKEHTAVLHWHGDTFDLPDGATHLASSSKYKNQAFSWGECGLALQFHPEVTAAGLEHWFVGHAYEISSTPDLSVAELRKDTAMFAQKLEFQATLFWQTWLKQVEAIQNQLMEVDLMEIEVKVKMPRSIKKALLEETTGNNLFPHLSDQLLQKGLRGVALNSAGGE